MLSELTDVTYPEEVNSHSPIPKAYGKSSNFSVSDDMVHSMELPPNQFVSLNEKNVKQFVFVTGVSESHFNESKDAIASVQAHFPGRKLYYYDIGLNEEQKKQVYRFSKTKHPTCKYAPRNKSGARFTNHFSFLI